MANELKLTPEERIIKAKIRLGADPPEGRPFFSFLVSHLKFQEKKEIPTMGVTAYGDCYWNPDFIETLTDDELMGVISHEILHVCLEHMTLAQELKQYPELGNIASDIVVNNILQKDSIKLPEKQGALIPKNNEFVFQGYKVEKIDEKSSGEIYDELHKHFSKMMNNALQQAVDKGGKGRFDEHIHPKEGEGEGKDGNEKDGNGNSPFRDENDLKNHWRKVLLDACAHAKNRGCVPAGMERIIGELIAPKVNWKTYLFKYISSMIPMDYTWARPSKRTISTGIYLPSVEKESIEIISAIDTSGSISDEELKMFLGELVGITRSFKNVDLTIIDCDCSIHGVHTFKQATVGDIHNKVKLKGGGGTSHVPVFKWLRKEKPNAKFIICFTDGATEFPKKSDANLDVLWVVAGKNHVGKEQFPFGKVIVVK